MFHELTAELARVTDVGDPTELADRLVLIFEGVYATVPALGNTGPALRARALVQSLLPDATPSRARVQRGRNKR
jgi:hypothetical protein